MYINGARLLKDIDILQIQKAYSRFINPFIDHKHKEGVLSYGLEPFGYTIRLGDMFWIPPVSGVLDPKNHPKGSDVILTDPFQLKPHELIIGQSLEYIRIPPNIVAIGFGKSTYARMGVHVNITPLDAGWEGHLSISITNNGSNPIVLYPHEGIAQLLFFWSDELPVSGYDGNYQMILNPEPARVRKKDVED